MTIYHLCACFAIAFEAMIVARYFQTLFTEKYNTKVISIMYVISYSVMYLTYIGTMFLISSIVFAIINFLICYYFYSGGFKESVFHSLIITSLMCGTEILCLVFCGQFFESASVYVTEPIVGSLFLLISKLIFFMILQIIAKIFKGKKDNNNGELKVVGSLFINPLATLLMYSVFTDILLTTQLSPKIKSDMMSICILFLFANIFIYISYYKNQELNQKYTQSKIELQKEVTDKKFYQLLDEQNKSQQILIHDIKKHLDVIRGLARESSATEIRNYVCQIENTLSARTIVNFCDNHTLNLILGRYYGLLKQNSVYTNFIIAPYSLNYINSTDITSLFSNLLENAYEATIGLENAFVDLSVRYDVEDRKTVIILINNYKTEPKQSKTGEFITNKDKNHGYGTKSIVKVVDKYHGISKFYTDSSDETFHATITISPD
ncbi:MAG: GHKL domain-containing protein [Clostridia bacterium]